MPDLLREIACGGVSTAAVSAVLNPVDVTKTRRQLERFSDRRALEIARSLWAEGGVVALWRPGLAATIAREILYSGCTKGLYPVVRDAISGDADPTLPQRVAAASTTGFGGNTCLLKAESCWRRSLPPVAPLAFRGCVLYIEPPMGGCAVALARVTDATGSNARLDMRQRFGHRQGLSVRALPTPMHLPANHRTSAPARHPTL